MRRARSKLVAASAFAFVLLPAVVSAFHTGSTFDKAPGAGGAGGFFYTGSPRERGWTCTACHIGAPGRIAVSITSEPIELLGEGRYTADASYDITVTLSEREGFAAGISNHNGLAVTVLDDDGLPLGSLGGFSAADFHARGSNIIATSGSNAGETTWSFRWTAPAAGAGTVHLYFGVVDGNGADSAPSDTLTDPLGDDVFVAEFTATVRR